MWNNAESVSLVDDQGIIVAISRNEVEDPIKEGVGTEILYRVTPDSLPLAVEAIAKARGGEECELLVSAEADAGYVFWVRAVVKPSPVGDRWVIVHSRRLPRAWGSLSTREREVVAALHASGLNSKKAARALGVSINTFNAHRRSITTKCDLDGVGDFWVFVERCR
ncbi:MAG: LuxR C-terminal-related transcriptional regulator [Bythopirellula sp.]